MTEKKWKAITVTVFYNYNNIIQTDIIIMKKNKRYHNTNSKLFTYNRKRKLYAKSYTIREQYFSLYIFETKNGL